MKILAVDTSTRHLSVAVSEGDRVLVSRNFRPRKDLSLTITFDIERALAKAGVTLHEIDGFVVGTGPGSFTGLRVGISMIKAFVMVTSRPVVGIPSLDALALGVRHRLPATVCVMVDARRGLVYSALYGFKDTGLTRLGEYHLRPADELLAELAGPVLFTGDGITHYRELIVERAQGSAGRWSAEFEPGKHWLPQARELAHLGYQRLLRGESDPPETLVPLYLYPEDCQVDRSGGKGPSA